MNVTPLESKLGLGLALASVGLAAYAAFLGDRKLPKWLLEKHHLALASALGAGAGTFVYMTGRVGGGGDASAALPAAPSKSTTPPAGG